MSHPLHLKIGFNRKDEPVCSPAQKKQKWAKKRYFMRKGLRPRPTQKKGSIVGESLRLSRQI
jgi:hypothetical protein